MKKNIVFANIALVMASLCVSLLIGEFVLRSFVSLDPSRPFEFRIPHPVLGWVLQPNTTYIYQVPEGKVTVTYNADGWRDYEHDVEKPEGVFRVLVLGDSFMEANSVALDDTFHRRLEEFARASGRNVEVLNMGVAGYGTLQEYLVFRDIGRLYQPDLVLLGFFDGNDVINNSLELASMLTEDGQITNARPFLDMNESAWTVTPVDYEGAQRAYITHKAAVDAERKKLTNKLALLHVLDERIGRLRARGLITGQDNQSEPVGNSQRELALLGVNYCMEPAEYTRAWDATQRIFARFKEDVEASGGKLVVFTVPGIEEVSLEYMRAVRADVAYPDKLCLEEAPGHARLSQLLTDLKIEEISLLQDFRRVMNEDEINLYQSDLHWSPEGHTLAGETVLSELIRRGLFDNAGN